MSVQQQERAMCALLDGIGRRPERAEQKMAELMKDSEPRGLDS